MTKPTPGTCPPLRYWLLAIALSAVLGCAWRLDGMDDLDAARAAAADLADAQVAAQVAAQALAGTAGTKADQRRACLAARGADALFFDSPEGPACRRAPQVVATGASN